MDKNNIILLQKGNLELMYNSNGSTYSDICLFLLVAGAVIVTVREVLLEYMPEVPKIILNSLQIMRLIVVCCAVLMLLLFLEYIKHIHMHSNIFNKLSDDANWNVERFGDTFLVCRKDQHGKQYIMNVSTLLDGKEWLLEDTSDKDKPIKMRIDLTGEQIWVTVTN